MYVTGVDHVQLAAPAGCEEAARRFFGGVLGLPEIEKPPVLAARGGVWFGVGEQQLHVGILDGALVPARKAHPALRVARGRLDALAERLEAAGAPVEWDAAIAGVRRFFSADPWGNRIEFVEGTRR